MIPKPYAHQIETTDFILRNKHVFVASDPGVGKTRAVLDAIRASGLRALVLAPKSILEPAWLADCQQFTPELKCVVAYAHNRASAFSQPADVYITNHDATRWLVQNVHLLHGIEAVIIDESTAFKHHTSARSKAARQLMALLRPKLRICMSGTPNANDPLHLWHQILLLDDGLRLGRSFYKFRESVCIPETRGAFTTWTPKPGINEVLAELVSDITIRHKLEDCIDLPSNVEYAVPYTLTNPVRFAYKKLRDTAVVELASGKVSAVNAAVLHNKLLQTCSGLVYGEHGVVKIDDNRAELVAELVNERQQCVVAFHWAHQRDALRKLLNCVIIDGSVSDNARKRAIEAFTAGDVQVILAHPQSAGHGLTLTAGTSVIWPTPIANAELFLQFNRRIYRAGQKKRTETVVVTASNTIEVPTYRRCKERLSDQRTILELLQEAL